MDENYQETQENYEAPQEEADQENQGTEIEETKDVEILEFSLTREEIVELQQRLQGLLETGQGFEFYIDDDNALSISYENEDPEESSEGVIEEEQNE